MNSTPPTRRPWHFQSESLSPLGRGLSIHQPLRQAVNHGALRLLPRLRLLPPLPPLHLHLRSPRAPAPPPPPLPAPRGPSRPLPLRGRRRRAGRGAGRRRGPRGGAGGRGGGGGRALRPRAAQVREAAAAGRVRGAADHRHGPPQDRVRPRRAPGGHRQGLHQLPRRQGVSARKPNVDGVLQGPPGDSRVREQLRRLCESPGRRSLRPGPGNLPRRGACLAEDQPCQQSPSKVRRFADERHPYRGKEEGGSQEGAQASPVLQALRRILRCC